MTSTPNSLRTAASIAALLALVTSGFTACSSSGTNELIVSSDLAPSLTPAPTPGGPAGEGTPAEPAPILESDEPLDDSVVTPEEISTGPVLSWTEFDPDEVFGLDFVDINRIDSVGDGRVLASVFDLDGTSRVIVTENGSDWNEIPLPADIAPWQIDISGSRWLVTGWDTSSAKPANRAFYSDDEGAIWTELALDLGVFKLGAGTITVMAAEERMVLAVQSFPLIENGDDSLNEPDSGIISLFFSDGGPVERVAEYPGWGVLGYRASDGFHLILLGLEGESLLTSPDGRQWSSTSADLGRDRVGGSPMGAIWFGNQVEGEYRLERFNRPGQVAAVPDSVGHIGMLAAGPAGIAALTQPGLFIGDFELPDFRFAQDGFEVRYNEPEGGITLWDLSEDAAVYEFGPEILRSDTPPEGVREAEDEGGEPALLIFEDPETGEDLVAFDMAELGSAMAKAYDESSVGSGAGGESAGSPESEQWVGWSANGTDWGWQTVSDAFNLPAAAADEGGFTSVSLAVGEDFVIAQVAHWRTSGFDSAQGGPAESSPGSKAWR